MSRCSVTHEETVLAKLPQNHVQGPVPPVMSNLLCRLKLYVHLKSDDFGPQLHQN